MDKFLLILLALYSTASLANDRANSMNPNNSAYSASVNNRSNQMNPNNSAYWSSRGISNNHRSNVNNPNNKAYSSSRTGSNSQSGNLNTPHDNQAEQAQALREYSSNLDQAKTLYKAKKYKESITILSKPIYHNETEALNLLGVMHASGLGTRQDTKKAFKLYTKAARLNDKHAQHNLGMAYRYGNGVKKDINAALQWLTKSADQNLLISIQELSNIYFHGKETQKNIPKALNLYVKASEQGDLKSRYLVGLLHFQNATNSEIKKDNKLALAWVTSAAQEGLLRAQLTLAKLYCGKHGAGPVVLKNLKTCAQWAKKAHENKEDPNGAQASELWNEFELWKYE